MLLGKLISISTTSLFHRMAGSRWLPINEMMWGIMTQRPAPVNRTGCSCGKSTGAYHLALRSGAAAAPER